MRVDATVVKGRSELGRQLTMERYYNRGFRRVWIAYFWLLMLGGVAAHRFYLRKWKSGIALLLLVWVPTIALIALTSTADPQLNSNNDLYKTALEIFRYVPAIFLLIIIIEIISIPFLTTSANRNLKKKLLRDFQLDGF